MSYAVIGRDALTGVTVRHVASCNAKRAFQLVIEWKRLGLVVKSIPTKQ